MASSVRINKEGIICPHFLTFTGQKTLRYPMLSSLRLIRVFVQTAHTTHTNTKLVYDVSATLEYFNKRTLSTVLMRDNYTYFAATSKKWVSKQVLVSTYRYKTILGCDPEKIGTTIPNEEEIALKHSSLDN